MINIVENDRLALATGAVCGVQELLCESNYQDIKKELDRVNVLKQVHSNFYPSQNVTCNYNDHDH